VGSIPASRTKTEGPSVKLGPFSFKPLFFILMSAQAAAQNTIAKNTYKTPTKYLFHDLLTTFKGMLI
jgi:hypothetical protein